MPVKNHFIRKICLTVLLALSVTAKSADAPKYSNEFLSIGIGANNMAMGNAVAATTHDVMSAYWNPAGMVHIPNSFQTGFMHSEYFAGIAKYDYLGFVVPLDSNKQALGFSAIRFAVDDIPNTLELVGPDGSINYDNVKSFSIGDYGFYLSYARQIVKGLSAGGSAKIVHHKAGSFAKSWGFGMDFGAQYAYKDWRFGLMIKDITTTFNAWSFSFTDREKEVLELTDNVIPDNSLEITLPKIILAAAYTKTFKKVELTAEIDVDITVDGKRNVLIATDPISFDPHIGIETGFWDIVYARVGINNIQKITNDAGDKKFTVQPNLGLGFRFKGFFVDYAYTDVGKTSETQFSHVVSAKLGFNKRKKD